ncbi:MAG: glycosyltransferase family 2 protein [Acidobacteria bacterium]|nr:glycosyltransferase family 2 protein [Acidobacteriota bacterium]
MTIRTRLVVPCYNEAARLRPGDFLDFLAARPDAALLFVDDGSTDGTGRILAELAARAEGRAEVLTLPRNAGKARAVHEGVAAALAGGSELVGYWDADLSTPLDAVASFEETLAALPRVDLVMGARVKLLGRDIQRLATRHYAGRVFATAASLVLGLGVYDTQCGAKLFRSRSGVADAFREPFRSKWIFDVEMLARFVRAVGPAEAASRIYEFPLLRWRHAPGSKLMPHHTLRAAWDLLLIAIGG